MFSFVRRPAYPGELNHELVWPLAFLGGSAFAAIWFQIGLKLPDCIFFKFTGLPCLGCGGTRCARHLESLDFSQAFLFHPGFFLIMVVGGAWTLYSAVFWLRRDTLRLRPAWSGADSLRLRWVVAVLLLVHWAWQCYYLTR